MITLYNLILYNPLLNVLIFFYNTIAAGDLGLAIIFLTLLIRLILFPVFQKSTRHQTIMTRLQPELKKIKDTHKNNREKQVQAMMALYKEHRVNPFSGFLLLFIQLPILIALYQIFLKSLQPGFLSGLYAFISAPGDINTSFLGLINLGDKSIVMVGLAAIAQYFQGSLALPKRQKGQGHSASQAERMSRQMVFLGPAITLVIFYKLPAAVGLYWVVTSLFSIVQQAIINRNVDHGQPGNLPKNNP